MPLPTAATNTTTHLSALPLWAVAASDPSSPRVFLNNVTLMLPQQDFLALLQTALLMSKGWQGCGGGAAAAASPLGGVSGPPVLAGVSTFELHTMDPPTLQGVSLAAYVGWGVSAVDLMVHPDTPFPADYDLPPYSPCLASALSSGGSSGSNSATGIGLGVGLGVGLGLVALAILAVGVYRHR